MTEAKQIDYDKEVEINNEPPGIFIKNHSLNNILGAAIPEKTED